MAVCAGSAPLAQRRSGVLLELVEGVLAEQPRPPLSRAPATGAACGWEGAAAASLRAWGLDCDCGGTATRVWMGLAMEGSPEIGDG